MAPDRGDSLNRRVRSRSGAVAVKAGRASRWVALLLLPLRVPVGLASKIDEEPELASEQVRQEAVLELRYARLKARLGVGDRRTLEVFFELFDLWIMLYRLNKADFALREVVPACEWRQDDLTIKAVQALAFTRWKQGRFREALGRFHELEGWFGKNPALCENIGHTYTAIGAYDEAELYFNDAMALTKALPRGTDHNAGGVMLGLAWVQERRGSYDTSLATSMLAYEYYKERDAERGWESSFTAKAAMQVSKSQLNLGRLPEAEAFAREAVRIFEVTAGDDSPLVASALQRLGRILVAQDRLEDARSALHRAYRLEAAKDAFDLQGIMEIHGELVGTHLSALKLDQGAFQSYFEVVTGVVGRVREEMLQDGNAGAYYKVAGELFALGASCALGRPLLAEAVSLLEVETSIDTSGLVRQCLDLVAYCDGTYDAGPPEPGEGGAGRDEL